MIPSSWNVLKGKILFKEEKRPIRQQDEIVTCFRDGQVTLRKNRRLEGFTNSLKEIGYKGIRKGDLVIHNMDAFAGAIGVSDSDGKGTPVYAVCTPIREDVNQYYYCFLLRFLAKIGFIQSLAKGIRERSTDFRYGDFKELLLPVPSRAEQDAIVRYLDAATSKIDKAIAMQQKMIDLLNERKQIIVQNAVTKGLDDKVEMKDSGVEWIGMIPKHWKIIRLKNVFYKRIAGSWGNEQNVSPKNTVCLRIADFEYSRLQFKKRENYTIRSYTAKEIENKKLSKGDLLIEKSGGGEKSPVGRCVVYNLEIPDVMYANFMEKLSTRGNVDSYFICYLLSCFYSQGMIWPYVKATTGIQNLDIASLLSKEYIFVPPKSEQQAIVAYLDKQMQRFDSAITNCQRQITLLQERKQIIINEVVTGKVKVS